MKVKETPTKAISAVSSKTACGKDAKVYER